VKISKIKPVILESEYKETFPYGENGDAFIFLEYLHQISSKLVTANVTQIANRMDAQSYIKSGRVISKSFTSNDFVVEELFRIEYLKYSRDDELEESLRSLRANWFTIPMEPLIPCLEELYAKEPYEFDRKVSGKLPTILSAILKNEPKGYSILFKKILNIHVGHVKHKNVVRMLNKPPKYLTFFFEYKNYFDNAT
jgi:hypothetical protein